LSGGQTRLTRFLYDTVPGRMLLRPLVQPCVSRTLGRCLDASWSKGLIRPFVRQNSIDLGDFPSREYTSFNDFFTRQVLPERRPVDPDPRHLIAPCDGWLTLCPIRPGSQFTVKGVPYTVEELLQDNVLAQNYRGGTLLLFRLTVADLHRYIWCSDGIPGIPHRIPGVLHTVHPIAAAARPIYRQNTREYVCLSTEAFGNILVMEVGALLVGRIQNHPYGGSVKRGEEKGMFLYGGSTIIMLLEADRVTFNLPLRENTSRQIETQIRLGACIGTAACV